MHLSLEGCTLVSSRSVLNNPHRSSPGRSNPSVAPQSFDDGGEGVHEVIRNRDIGYPKPLPEPDKLLAHLLRRARHHKWGPRTDDVLQVRPKETSNPLPHPIRQTALLWLGTVPSSAFEQPRPGPYVATRSGLSQSSSDPLGPCPSGRFAPW